MNRSTGSGCGTTGHELGVYKVLGIVQPSSTRTISGESGQKAPQYLPSLADIYA
jgi:hypothetical protein